MDQQHLLSGTNFNPLQNFKGFASSRPPLLVFLICLLAFAVTAASLAFVVHRTDLKDPAFVVDWNDVLGKLTGSDICIHGNGSSWKSAGASVLSEEQPFESTDDSLLSFDVGQGSTSGRNNYSVSFLVKFKFGIELKSLAPNITTITGAVCRHSLGLTDNMVSEQIGITVSLPAERHLTHCNRHQCQPEFPVCITFHGLPKLPVSKKMTTCSAAAGNLSTFGAVSFTVPQCDEAAQGKGHRRKSECDGMLLPIHYQSNPDWSIFLSEHERALINLHLIYTSYFLLVMAMTLVCYAIIRGRPKQKIFIAERLPLDS